MGNIWVCVFFSLSMWFCVLTRAQDTTVAEAFILEEDVDFLRGNSLWEMGQYEKAVTHYKRAQRKISEIEDSVITSFWLADSYNKIDNDTDALVHIEFLLKLDPNEFSDKLIKGLLAEANHQRRYIAQKHGDLELALELMLKTVESFEKDSIHDIHYIRMLHHLALSYSDLELYEESVATLLKSLQRLKEVKADQNYKREKESEIYSSLGDAFKYLMDLERAKNYYELALSNSESLNAVNSMIIYSNLASLFVDSGEIDSAIVYHEFALNLFDQIPAHSYHYIQSLPSILSDLGSSYDELGQHKKAKVYLEKALKKAEENFDTYHRSLLTIINSLYINAMMMEDLTAAEKYARRALTISRAKNNSRGTNMASSNSYNQIAKVYIHNGDIQSALLYADSAFLSNELITLENSRVYNYLAFFETFMIILDCWNNLTDSIEYESQIFRMYELFLDQISQLRFKEYSNLAIERIQYLFRIFYAIFDEMDAEYKYTRIQ